MKKILLVAPDFRSPGWNIEALPLLQAKALIVPLHIATVAALTPDDMEVDLWDESVHGYIDEEAISDKEYDLVGITSHSLSLQRVREIAQVFQRRGTPVAVGGSGVSSAPELCRDDFDVLFVGEAELTWLQFIADWKAGSYRKEYREVTFPDMVLSPSPRWDAIEDQMRSYLVGAVQTSRGCPFGCEFCDIAHLFGRRTRCKPIDRVLEEVVELERLGLNVIAFCDDNFIGNPRYAKELLRELISLNNSFAEPLALETELTINVAQDEEMLSLLSDANFTIVSTGIESPNKQSLKEANKVQNLRSDLVADCRKMISYGIPVEASIIVGFDHDTREIFDQQFEFLQETCMSSVKVNILKAPQGTRLWHRLFKEGRLLSFEKGLYDKKGFFSRDPRGATNIIPKGMTRTELLSGYLSLMKRLYDWDNFAARIKGFISNVERQPNVPQKSKFEVELSPVLNAFLLSLDEKAQRAISGIFSHTYQHAPFMMRKVFRLICGQYLNAANLPLLSDAILKQIQFEESADMEQFINREEDYSLLDISP